MSSLVAVGDIMLGDSPTTVGFGTRSRYPGSDIRHVFTQLARLLFDAGLAIGNLESPLTAIGIGRTRLARDQMRGDTAYARVLREVGFDALGVANNHAMQHGRAAFDETVACLAEHNIVAFGLRGSGAWSSAPVRLPVKGVGDVGILGYCWRPRQYSRAEPAYAEGDRRSALDDIERLRPSVNRLIVSLHWGDEFLEFPSARDREFAHEAVAAGADVIVGHHPHVVRPVEPVGTGIVAYSLGNAVSDMLWMESLRRGVGLRVSLASGAAALASIRSDDEYVARVVSEWTELRATDVTAIPEDEYRRRVARTVLDQRRAAYRYAARNAWRYPIRVGAELVATTVYNKLSGLWNRDG